jgi:hypothetical protein
MVPELKRDSSIGVSWSKGASAGTPLPIDLFYIAHANGLIVNGNDVTLYGLFAEHSMEYETIWNGNGGRCYFYQNELPFG